MAISKRSEPPLSPARVLFPLGLGTALSLMGDATLYTVLPTHTADAGIALGSVGIMLGVNRAIRVFLNGPAGLAYDRFPRRRLFVPALFLGALSTLLYATLRGFWPLLVARLLWGVAWSGIWVGGATVILDVTTTQNRGRWSGLYQTWFFLGAGIGSFGGGFLTDQVGYTTTMWIGAAVTALGGLAALLMLPETRGAGLPTRRLAASEALALPLRHNRRLWVAVGMRGLNRFVTAGVVSATLALLVQGWLGQTNLAVGVATLTGALKAGRTFVAMGAAPLAGALSDRLGSRWGVAAIAMVLGAVGLILVVGGGLMAILAGVGLISVATAGVQSLSTALAGDLVGEEQRGRAIGLLHTVGDIGSAVGPPLAYWLMPAVGLRGLYWACAVLFAVGAATMWLSRDG